MGQSQITRRAPDGELYNDDRADRAQAAIDAYVAYTDDAPDESHFRDLLCDLRHLAAREGAGEYMCEDGQSLTFDQANEIAGCCFADEVEIEASRDDVEELITMTSVKLLETNCVTFSPDDSHPSANGIYANADDLKRASFGPGGWMVTDNDADEPLTVLVSQELMVEARKLLGAELG